MQILWPGPLSSGISRREGPQRIGVPLERSHTRLAILANSFSPGFLWFVIASVLCWWRPAVSGALVAAAAAVAAAVLVYPGGGLWASVAASWWRRSDACVRAVAPGLRLTAGLRGSRAVSRGLCGRSGGGSIGGWCCRSGAAAEG